VTQGPLHLCRVESRGQLTVRPQIPWDRYRLFGALFGGFLLFLAPIPLLVWPKDRLASASALLLVVAILVVGGARLYLVDRLSSVRADKDRLVYVSPLGRSQVFQRSLLSGIACRTVEFTVRSSFAVSYFVFVGRNNRALFKLPLKWWPEEGVATLAGRLDLPVTGDFFQVVDGPAFRREFPGSLPWVLAHPRLAAAGAGVLAVPAIFAVAYAFSVISSLVNGTPF